MEKISKKKTEAKLVDAITKLLSEMNSGGARKISKTIKKESKYIVKKFSKAAKKNKIQKPKRRVKKAVEPAVPQA